MSLTSGTTLGPYAITAKIGEGGMGEVYRARDTNLDRNVAIKVLPETFTSDPDRLARFEREAKVLASLNHPNIGAIYGLEKSGDTRALVLELIEGPTLAERIKQGPIPLDEALAIAKQIAEALEAAHEQGIIHRDLKPANIKVKDDGTVKVLDFGLAKALDTTPEGDPSQSPTLTAAATQMGVIMGTAAYMSPEQARGKAVDKRADIWSFGVVLYEMLTGQRAFQGEDVSLTLASVMKSDVKVTTLPPDLPANVRTVLRRCLEKDVSQRVRDIGDVRLAMEGAFETTGTSPSESSAAPRLQVWQRPLPAIAAAVGLVLATSLAVWTLLGSGTQRSPSPTRFTLTLPDSDRLPAGFARGALLALSPDGQALVYGASRDGMFQLFHRPLDQFEATPMPGTETGGRPFFSHDGQWVGFYAGGALLKVALAGGPAQTLTALPSRSRGADWGADDMIVFGLAGPGGPLMRIPAAGGDPTVLFTPEDRRASGYPQVLPGGDAVLFTVTEVGLDASELHLFMFDTGEHRTLVPNAAAGRVLDTGHLVFVRSGALWAVPFDPERLDVVGNPVPVVEGVRVSGLGDVDYAVADDGSLVYIPGDVSDEAHSLVWVDRNGGEELLATPAANYVTLSLSPNGARAAVGITDETGNADVWVSELARGTLTRLTTDEAFDGNPLWHPDGRRVAFVSDRSGKLEVFWQAADGSGTAERLLTMDDTVTNIVPSDWSPDGAMLFVHATLPGTDGDVGMLPIDGPGTWEPLIQTAAIEVAPTISPDGRWLAYTSDETGRHEVYVQRFPELEDRRQISVGGGLRPNWSADGLELTYLRSPAGPPDAVMRVTLNIDEGDPPSLIVGTPERHFDWRHFMTPGGSRQHDVSPDGQRFLMITRPSAGAGRNEINVVLNWDQELLERVPIP